MIVRRRTETTHQQRMSRSGSRVIEREVGESRQRQPLAFVLEKNILSTCCNNINTYDILRDNNCQSRLSPFS